MATQRRATSHHRIPHAPSRMLHHLQVTTPIEDDVEDQLATIDRKREVVVEMPLLTPTMNEPEGWEGGPRENLATAPLLYFICFACCSVMYLDHT